MSSRAQKRRDHKRRVHEQSTRTILFVDAHIDRGNKRDMRSESQLLHDQILAMDIPDELKEQFIHKLFVGKRTKIAHKIMATQNIIHTCSLCNNIYTTQEAIKIVCNGDGDGNSHTLPDKHVDELTCHLCKSYLMTMSKDAVIDLLLRVIREICE